MKYTVSKFNKFIEVANCYKDDKIGCNPSYKTLKGNDLLKDKPSEAIAYYTEAIPSTIKKYKIKKFRFK